MKSVSAITPGLNKLDSIQCLQARLTSTGFSGPSCKIRKVKTVRTCPYCKRELKVVSIAPDYSFVIWRCDVHGCLRFDYSAKKWVLGSDSTRSIQKTALDAHAGVSQEG